MSTQPNAGRDVETDILRVLAEADGPVPYETVRSLLPEPLPTPRAATEAMMLADRKGWLLRTPPSGGRASWSLTDEGHRVAEARGLARRAEG